MANARIISQVVLDRNAFLPSLKLRLRSGCSELAAIWSLSGEIVAVVETSATLWLLLLVKNTNERILFGDPPLKRSFDLRDLTLFAISNVNARLWINFALLYCWRDFLARSSETCLSGFNLGMQSVQRLRPATKATFSSTFQHLRKKIRLIAVQNAHLRQ